MSTKKFSRREFLGTPGTATADLLLAPRSTNVLVYGSEGASPYLTRVAITQAEHYDARGDPFSEESD